jgi:hypothetical protein
VPPQLGHLAAFPTWVVRQDGNKGTSTLAAAGASLSLALNVLAGMGLSRHVSC